MDAGTAVAIATASGTVSFAVALIIVSIVALHGVPPEKRAEVIDALARLFRRPRPELPRNRQRDNEPPAVTGGRDL